MSATHGARWTTSTDDGHGERVTSRPASLGSVRGLTLSSTDRLFVFILIISFMWSVIGFTIVSHCSFSGVYLFGGTRMLRVSSFPPCSDYKWSRKSALGIRSRRFVHIGVWPPTHGRSPKYGCFEHPDDNRCEHTVNSQYSCTAPQLTAPAVAFMAGKLGLSDAAEPAPALVSLPVPTAAILIFAAATTAAASASSADSGTRFCSTSILYTIFFK